MTMRAPRTTYSLTFGFSEYTSLADIGTNCSAAADIAVIAARASRLR